MTYEAIDEMIECHGKEKPEHFGSGLWDAEEEFIIYQEQVGDRYSELQWSIISKYFEIKFKEKKDK
jgi:hypothetical protein